MKNTFARSNPNCLYVLTQEERHLYSGFIEPIRFWTQENNDTALTATSVRLLGIYSGVIFFIICMTVLALHLITASLDQRTQYQTLYQLGVEKTEIIRMVNKQSLLYFFTPSRWQCIYLITNEVD